MIHHIGPIAGIASWGNWVATAGYDNQLILWNGSDRSAVARGYHDHLVNDCRFSNDGKWLVSASSDYSARIWSIPNLRLQAVLPGHGDDVDMAVFSPDDSKIATCALDRIVRIFNLNGQCIHEMSGHTGNVLSVSWSKDSQFVISSSVDGTIRRWNANSGELTQTTNLDVRSDSVEIDINGTIFAGDDLGRIAILSGEVINFVQAHRAGIKKLVVNFQKNHIVTLSYDRSMATWQINSDLTLKELSRTDYPVTVWARAACILENGNIATGTFGSTYALFDPQTNNWNIAGVSGGQSINAVELVNSKVYSVGDSGVVHINGQPTHQMGSLCNFLVASNDLVITGGQLGSIFNANTDEVIYTHHSPLNCGVSYQYGGVSYIAIGAYTGEILVFKHLNSNQIQLEHVICAFVNAVKGLSYSDGLLFSVCASAQISWYSVMNWALIKTKVKAHEKITNACCAIGENHFASVGRDLTLRIWEGDESSIYVTPHQNSIKCMGINTNKTVILTGSYGGTLSLFDLREKSWIKTSRPTSAGISSIAWDHTKECFLAGSYDGEIYSISTNTSV